MMVYSICIENKGKLEVLDRTEDDVYMCSFCLSQSWLGLGDKYS